MALLIDSGDRYATIRIGEPPQEIEMDLNMLASDFYIAITTSRSGSRYDDLFSQSKGRCFLSLKAVAVGSCLSDSCIL